MPLTAFSGNHPGPSPSRELFLSFLFSPSLSKLSLRFTLVCPRDSFFDSVRQERSNLVTRAAKRLQS